jgi:hypothetical protein
LGRLSRINPTRPCVSTMMFSNVSAIFTLPAVGLRLLV